MDRHLFRRIAGAASAAIMGLALVSCSTENADSSGSSTSKDGDTLEVFATTGYIGDAVKQIAPDAHVDVMVGPGGDPHTYQATTKDTEKIQNADLVLWNGLHMEAHMLDELSSQGDRQLAVGEVLPEQNLLPWPETDEQGNPLHDPHIWNSTENWSIVVDAIANKLGEVDPKNKDTYEKNAADYKKEIEETASYVQEKINSIPQDRRYLITGHDAFNYLGKQFGLEIKATDFVTSESEMTPQDIKELADFIAEHEIPVIFQDNLQNPQAINSLKEAVRAKGWEVEVSDKQLYADSLGESAPTDTYIGVMKYNADAISEALSK